MSKDSRQCILILEDNPDHRFIYDQVLGFHYQLQFLDRISDFFELLKTNPKIDLAIFDLNLVDGPFTQIEEVKKHSSQFPFIVISMHDDANILRNSFRAGASDYLIKPFNKTELLVKVERILTPEKLIEKNFKENLTPKEKMIFDLFKESNQHLVSRETMNKVLWQKVEVNPNALDVLLYKLRKKISTHGYRIEKYGTGDWQLVHDSQI